MRHHAFVAALVLGALVPAAASAVAAPYAGAVLPVAEVREGMEGYGLTVFHGSRIDTFGVRVLGVQRGARPAGSIILAELSGHGLEATAIPQGMSGSPVFLEGKLAGAVAFGWSGALKPIAGLTPAEEILALPQPDGAAAAGLRADAAGPDPLALLDPAGHSREMAARILGPEADAMPAAVHGGAADREPGRRWPEPAELAARLLREAGGEDRDGDGHGGEGWRPLPAALLVAPLGGVGERADDAHAAGGAAWADAPFLPGSACGVPLVLGDAQMGAIGTATWVDGDRVFLMGPAA